MNIGNITSNGMNLDYNGKVMQIEVYEKEIERLNNIINKAIEYIEQKKLQPRLRTANTYSLQERQLLDILKGSESDDYNSNSN